MKVTTLRGLRAPQRTNARRLRTHRSGRISAATTTLALAGGLLLTGPPAPAAARDATAPGGVTVAAQSPTDDEPAKQAAGWLVRQLEANDYTMPGFSPGNPDWGLTIDALFALAASGVGGDAAEQVVDKILEDGATFIAWASDTDMGSRAKLALALQVGGQDPTAFDTGDGAVDLIQTIRDSMQANGRLGATTNHFGQTLAVLALARTAEGVPEKALDYLESLQCLDEDSPNYGGLGYDTGGSTCGNVDGDATGFMLSGLVAGGRDAGDSSVSLAVDWMVSHQDDDGGFKASYAGAPANTNSTGLVANAARQIGSPTALTVADKARGFIEGLEVGCGAPFNSDDDPAAGPGFARSWIGAIAYGQEGYDDAVANGIPQFQTDQWRRASTQAILGLGDLPGFSDLTTEGMAPDAPAADSCDGVGAAATTVTVTSLPATSRYGTAKALKVAVAADGGGDPRGTVEARRGTKVVASAPVSSGKATVSLAKTMSVGKANLTIAFVPDDTSQLQASTTTATHTVQKARTTLVLGWKVRPTPTKAGVIRVTVVQRDGSIAPGGGKVTVAIGKHIINKQMSSDEININVGKLKKGTYASKARYYGNGKFGASPRKEWKLTIG